MKLVDGTLLGARIFQGEDDGKEIAVKILRTDRDEVGIMWDDVALYMELDEFTKAVRRAKEVRS